MGDVLKKFFKILKPGGAVLFRGTRFMHIDAVDYGLYDMTQLRFIYKEGRKMADNYYVRADGTTVFYYTTGKVGDLYFNLVKKEFPTYFLKQDLKLMNLSGITDKSFD